MSRIASGRAPAAAPTRAPTAAAARPRANGRTGGGSGIANYLRVSERPLHSLWFVLPLLVIYQFGSGMVSSELIAFQLLNRFFEFFGASGRYLPAAAVVGVLLTWHLAQRDPWELRLGVLAGMAFESAMLAIPLLSLAEGIARWSVWVPLFATTSWQDHAVISVGAGIYEELVFRLIGLTVLSVILVDLLQMPRKRATVLMVVGSAVLFSLYHYLGAEPFTWRTCIFRALAGIYFATVFLCRGFGVAAGAHVTYDVFVVILTLHS